MEICFEYTLPMHILQFKLNECISVLIFQVKMNSLAFSVLLLASVASAELVKVGDFQNYAHGINGEVFMKDEKTLVIKGFTYDGAGPDAFFWAGTSQTPSSVGTILPYPFEGKFYEYEDQSAPILSKRFNGEEIV